ncbi:A-kinase anchor protein 17A isoform X2 [Eupeodes corollae]|nr:A-kinase anchor protein 17A isoform X2 [Eupeodes corollae]
MGKSISNFDIMDKLTKAFAPDKFLILKVTKSTLENIKLEAELEEPSRLPNALARLDGMSFKVSGFTEHFKVRTKEAKDEFPNRHDWDIFFRDAHYMDEMKAGERPDTIHFANLPIRWFCPRHMENDENVKPSESIFKRIFEKFGPVRAVDIPVCDVFRQKMSSDVNGIHVHNFEQDLLFEGYVQFEEYIGFVRAMDEFRGMKLVRKFVDKTQAINLIVNFDKKKHLSEASILRRERMRKSLLAKVKTREEEEENKRKKEQEKLERERKIAEEIKLKELERQREREEQRKQKHLKKLEEKGQIELSRKIRLEEKKLLIVRRKLESIRVLEALFERLKVKDLQEKGKSISHTSVDLRQRLVDKYKSATEKLLDEQKRKVESEKIQTGLLGLLKSRKSDKGEGGSANGNAKENGKKRRKSQRASSNSSSSSSEDEPKKKHEVNSRGDQVFNPFKDVYTPEAAAELMKMSMLSYGVFPGMPVYRPFAPTHAMRGYIPRGRGGGMRGPRRGGFNYHGSSSGYPYKNYYNDYRNDAGMSHDYSDRHGGYNNSRSYSRSRSRKRSRSRSRIQSRSHSRSRSRTRSRHRRYSRSRRSRHRSDSRSHSRSRSRSRSRSHRSRTRERSNSRSQSRTKDHCPRNKSRSPPNSKSHSHRSRSDTRDKSSRNRSRSISRNHRSRSKSRSQSRIRSKRSRTLSKPKETSSQQRLQSRSQSKTKTTSRRSSSRNRASSKSRSDSKSKKRSSSKSKKRSNTKSHHSGHRSKAKSRSRSSSKNKLNSKKNSKQLVSTRRSHSPTSWSKSPSEPRRSWSAGEP